MKVVLAIVVFVVLVAIQPARSVPAKGSTKASLKKNPCLKECTADYKPVCAGEGTEKRSFGSECVLANYNCENGKDWKVISQGECPGGSGVRLS